MDREKVISAIENCIGQPKCRDCPWDDCESEHEVVNSIPYGLLRDAIALLKEQDEEHRRLLSWLGKFCRHIDNGDAWLTDEENIAFFKEKIKQQFGWDTD